MARVEFRLEDSFVSKWINTVPDWGPIGYITYKRTYARPIETLPERYYNLANEYNLKGTEEWWLTVTRVVEGTYRIQEQHIKTNRLHWNAAKAQRSAQEMFRLIFEMKFLPPGRGLWMMGTDYVMEKGGAALNNCSFVSTEHLSEDFSGPFCFLMDMSMLGVGVGGDCKGAGEVEILQPRIGQPHEVDDSREGWVNLVRRVLDSYVGRATYPCEVDYSEVRGQGEPIKGFGGTSSGPKPLIELIDSITKLLNVRIGSPIRSSDIVDIFNLIGRCVVSGNVRRSAEIMFGEPEDSSFLNLKNMELYPDECSQHRWASNNSIFAEVGMDYSVQAELSSKFGEPGYEWLENARSYSRMGHTPDFKDINAGGGNPCLEQTLESFELCCLVETFPSRHETFLDFKRTLKMAYMYAKTVTLLPTHDHRANAVMLRNRRIGTSQTGVIMAMNKHGRRNFFEWSDMGYEYLCEVDKIYSNWFCIPESIKKTSIKPSGTVSLLPGVTPGVHFPHSEYYYRVIRFATDSPMLPKLRDAGYRCIEIDPIKEPNTTAVYFPIKEKHFNRAKADVSIWEQLEIAAQCQQYWADNQVSCTVTFKPEEADQIKYALELYETRLKGISFLPLKLHGYEHAPYQEIDKETYDDYIKDIKQIVSFNGTARNEVIDKFCDGEACSL